MKVVGAFYNKREGEIPAFKQVVKDAVDKWVKPLGISPDRVKINDFDIGDVEDNFYAIVGVTYPAHKSGEWISIYNKFKNYKDIEKELYKNYKKLNSKNLIINTIDVNPSPLVGCIITISGNVVK